MLNMLDLSDCVICSSCGTDIFEYFKIMGKAIEPYERYVLDFTALAESEVTCDVCQQRVEFNENYHSVTVPEEMMISIADYLSKDIGGCEKCHGNERRWMEHSYNSDPFESTPIDLGGSAHSAGSFLDSRGVPEKLIPIFVSLIRCSCGYGRYREDGNNPDGGVFREEDDVYSYHEVDNPFGFGYFETEEFLEFAKKYGETISDSDLLKLKETLKTKPMLAYKDPAGVAIYKVLKKHYDQEDFSVLRSNEVRLYRGRTRPLDSGKQFAKEEMWAAPQGKTSHGRYNFIGVSVLYVTDQEKAIPLEVNPSHDQLIDVISFDISKKRLRLFDLGSFDPGFQGFFNEVNEESNTVKSAYLLPNFIGTCCSDIGYDGIKYLGVHQSENDERYVNYALFDIKQDLDLIAAGEVKTYRPIISIKMEPVEIHPPPLPPDAYF